MPGRGPSPQADKDIVRISSLELGVEEEELVLAVIRSGQIAQGPMVERFENLCAEMAGSQHAVAVANGTVSLEAILEALGIGRGDEVITSPLTFVATLNAIIRGGATARFADVRPDFTIDPASVEALINERTVAVMPVHLYGLPADMSALTSIANRHGLALIEDAAQAHGASVDDRKVGSFGAGSFSFYATKNVTSGEGGVITTSDAQLADRLRLLRNQGMRSRYEYTVLGRNIRLTDLQAALAIPQLQRLPAINAKRRANAESLSLGLADVDGLTLPFTPSGRVHVWHQYTVLLAPSVDRQRVVEELHEAGVGAGVYYPRLVWDYPPFEDRSEIVRDDSPMAADVVSRCISLPVHQGLSAEALEKVARTVSSVLSGR